jgi:tetratricopeptide (TPR) repeat protein/predicted Ser/Thr protein kinase
MMPPHTTREGPARAWWRRLAIPHGRGRGIALRSTVVPEESQPRVPAPGERAPLRRGALSALLEDLARAPRPALEEIAPALRPGQALGRYEILREIGRGGFGVVYEARDRELNRLVAVKTVRARRHDPPHAAMLKQEAEAAAQLNHPNIVTLHDAGQVEGTAFLVMERLHGETLEARLERGPLPPQQAVRIAAEVARGLAHAHAAGVLHRDLKPSNVLVTTDGAAKILDFGLSRLFGSGSGEAGGTPGYMAPEQWRGEADDERTDVFALGVMLHQMLTGRLPYEVKEGRSTALDPGPPPPLDGLPREVRPFLGRALSRDPAGRPRGARAALEALLEAERALAGGSAPRRRGLLWAAAAAAVLALAAGAALRLRGPGQPPARIPVAVADFANETGDPDLNGLSGMLITSLEQSRHLQVLTRARMVDLLRQMGKEPATRLDEVLGRELGRQAGVKALVLATIRRFDQVYAIEMQVLDPATDQYLFAVKEQGTGKASIPGLIDRLSEQTRQRLREAPAEVEASRVKVAEATTASLEAYEHYFRGQQQEERTRYDEALAEYRAALAADPGFALAHYRIAYLGEFTGLEAPERREHIVAALANSGRVGEKERLLIRAWQSHMEKRNEEAHRLYAQAVEAWPQEKEVLYMAADLYFHEGQTEKAQPLFERALQLDPVWEPALVHLVDCLGAAIGSKEELLTRTRRWAEQSPGPSSYRALATALAQNGKLDQALEQARRAYAMEPNLWSRGTLSDILLHRGAFAEVEALVRPVVADGGRSKKERAHAAGLYAAALSLQGRRREALQALEVMRDMPHAAGTYHETRMLHFLGDGALDRARAELEAAVRAVQAENRSDDKKWKERLPALTAAVGDLEGAAVLARSLEPGSPAEMLYRGVAAWRSGRLDEAAAALKPLSERGDDNRIFPLYILGELEVARGHDAESLEALERFRGTFGGGYWKTWAWPRSLLTEARALDALGRRPEARDKVRALLETWKRGDADDPILREAKALAEKLREKTAASRP